MMCVETTYLDDSATRDRLADSYMGVLTQDVAPFWLRHGMDCEYGGIITSLNRDGSILDTDKSVWFQGRAAWAFATLYNTIERRDEWLHAARSCVEFARRHCFATDGKMYFLVTREGQPLRLRRYAFSEAFCAIGNAAYAQASGDAQAAEDSVRCFASFTRQCFGHNTAALSQVDPQTRPMTSIGPLMITIATAQEIRANVGDLQVDGKSCTVWIDEAIQCIVKKFVKPDLKVLMEVVGIDGQILDHFDGRMLNPGHAIECAWFIMHEGRYRDNRELMELGATILDWMWRRGWDPEYGGLFYFRDLQGLPVQEYWHDMKFWWPHNEAIIATLLAWRVSGEPRYAKCHRQVHEWSFRHFSDTEFGEWFGYLHRDGSISVPIKGSMWKGPFHLPRMLWYCHGLLKDGPQNGTQSHGSN